MVRWFSMLYLDRDMQQGEFHELAGGQAAVILRKSPLRGGPNEDAVAVLPIDEHHAVLAVADGLGGQPGGDMAARIAVEALRDEVSQCSGTAMRGGILDSFEKAHHALTELDSGAATTLLVAEIRDGRVRTYHTGDSMALLMSHDMSVKVQTVSHSPVGYAIAAGLLNESQAFQHHERHFVSNVVGGGEMRIEMGLPIELDPDDTLVLASDGLFDSIEIPEVVRVMARPPLRDAFAALVELTWNRMTAAPDDRRGKPDDLGLIAYRLNR